MLTACTGGHAAPATDRRHAPRRLTTTLGRDRHLDVSSSRPQVTIAGGYFNTEQFLTKLEGLKRAFLVTGFDIALRRPTDAKAGDVETDAPGPRLLLAPRPPRRPPPTTARDELRR